MKYSIFLAFAAILSPLIAKADEKITVMRDTTLPAQSVDVTNNKDFTITKRQAPAAFQAFRTAPNGSPVNAFQAMVLNGSVIDTTNTNFLATATPDNVTFSGWGIRGGLGKNPLVVSNFGAWFENNNNIVWTQELDVNNEGATQPEGSDKGGVGLAVHTGSTYSPDTAITVRRMKGAGSGPGFLRGLVIEGARTVGVRIIAMDSHTYPDIVPAAPGKIAALQVARSSDTVPRFTMDESGMMAWGSGTQNVDVNLSRTAPGTLTVNGAINDTVSWQDFSPVCQAQSGKIAAAKAVGRYNAVGRRVFFTMNLLIDRNGSGAGSIHCTLPVPARESLVQVAAGHVAVGTVGVGKALTAVLKADAEIVDFAGEYPGKDGAVLAVSGVYEAKPNG